MIRTVIGLVSILRLRKPTSFRFLIYIRGAVVISRKEREDIDLRLRPDWQMAHVVRLRRMTGLYPCACFGCAVMRVAFSALPDFLRSGGGDVCLALFVC